MATKQRCVYVWHSYAPPWYSKQHTVHTSPFHFHNKSVWQSGLRAIRSGAIGSPSELHGWMGMEIWSNNIVIAHVNSKHGLIHKDYLFTEFISHISMGYSLYYSRRFQCNFFKKNVFKEHQTVKTMSHKNDKNEERESMIKTILKEGSGKKYVGYHRLYVMLLPPKHVFLLCYRNATLAFEENIVYFCSMLCPLSS